MIVRLRPVSTMLVLALALAGCGKSPEEHFEQAKALYAKGDSQGTILELKNTLQEQPNNAEARLLLGRTYMAQESYADALKELERAQKNGVPVNQVLPLLAKTYLRTGQAQKVLDLGLPPGRLNRQEIASMQAARAEAFLIMDRRADVDQAIAMAEEANPGDPDLLVLKARLALQKGNRAEAIQFLDAAISQDENHVYAYYLKAAAQESEGKLDETLNTYREALQHDPKAFRAHLFISSIERRQGNLQASEKSLQAAEKAAPRHPLVIYSRAVIELQRNDLDAANESIQQVLKLVPDYLPARLVAALVNLGKGNYEQSLKDAQRVLAEQPSNTLAAQVVATSKLRSGDPKAAMQTLSKLLEDRPKDPVLLSIAGEASMQAQDYARAQSFLDQAEALNPGDLAIKELQATNLLAQGKTDLAIAELQQASKASGQARNADISLIRIHLQRKEFDQAFQAIDALEKKLPNSPVPHGLRAMAYVSKPDIPSARRSLEKALSVDPTYYPAAATLAELDLKDKDIAAARKRFDSILSHDKANVSAMVALANVALLEKKKDDYVNWLEKALKIDTRNMAAHAGLVRHHLAKQDKSRALAQAKQAQDTNPESLATINLLGATQAAVGDWGAAIDTYARLVNKAPQSAEALLLLAKAQSAIKPVDVVRKTLTQAIELKPDFLQAQDALIRLELVNNKPDAALAIARKIQAQQPRSPIGYDREGGILLSQKKYPQAVSAFEKALSLSAGGDVAGSIKLHRALFMAGNAKAADQRLTKLLSEHPKDSVLRTYAAEFFMVTKRNREAIAQYEVLLALAPNNALALNNLANLYLREKDSRALETAEKALKLAPDQPITQDTLGWILVEQGQLPRGMDLLSKAASKASKDPSVRYHYGAALYRAGKKTEAKKELAAALGIGKLFPEKEQAEALLKNL